MTNKNNNLKPRIEKLIKELTTGLQERDEIIAVSLLAALAGHNSFLFGPPGTAKSLISRRISCAFKETNYFECLMNKFSTPEEVVGPVSIKELKQDRYTRKTKSYLPTADFAFLDEIWKSSPAILNTLLTLINEKTFKNGDTVEKAPLKALIAASNETPASGQGLEALYDRFSVRLNVPPMQNRENFESILNQKPTESTVEIDDDLKISVEEWTEWQSAIHDVSLSSETLMVINLVRTELAEQSKELSIYVSDRRWQRAAMLIKASAFFNDRKTTNHSDALLLRHCLWTCKSNRKQVIEIVENAVKASGFNSTLSINKLDKEKEELDREINEELYASEDIYETVALRDGKHYFKVEAEFKRTRYPSHQRVLFIPKEHLKTTDEFNPLDEQGNEIDDIDYEFDGQGSCTISHGEYYYQDFNFTPEILYHKGDKKPDVNTRLIKSLNNATIELKSRLETSLAEVELKRSDYQLTLSSPFVPDLIRNIAIDGIEKQIANIQIRIDDCSRLNALSEA